MSRCLMALFKSLVNFINTSVCPSSATDDNVVFVRDNVSGIDGVLPFGVANSSVVLSWPNPLLELSSLNPIPPEATGVIGLIRLGSDAFFAV